jgi:hypothetical protein
MGLPHKTRLKELIDRLESLLDRFERIDADVPVPTDPEAEKAAEKHIRDRRFELLKAAGVEEPYE